MIGKLDSGMRCIKHMIFISNLLFVLIGVLLISIGATIHSVYGDFETFIESHHFKPAAFIIAIGVVILLVSLFGCVGAYRESTCLINVYGVFLFLLLILEIVAAIVAFSTRSDIYEKISENMFDTMKQYRKCPPARQSWDFMQERIGCCGVHNLYDWAPYKVEGLQILNEDNSNMTIPYSCCVSAKCENGLAYASGCFDTLNRYVSQSSLMIAYGAVSVAVVQFLGVIFAFILAKAIRRIKTERELKRQQARYAFYEQMEREQKDREPVPVLIYTPKSTEA